METFKDLLDQWPSMEALAGDVGATVHRVRKWRVRNRVPAEYWDALLRAAGEREIAATPELLVSLAAEQRDAETAA